MILRRLAKTVLARLGLLGPVRRLLRREHPHGHALLIRLLPGVARRAGNGHVVEVGTTREKLPGQGSTVLIARQASKLRLPFVTVDMDPANTEQARKDLAGIAGASAVTAKGEEYLGAFTGPIVAAYLDAFDIAHGMHSAYRIDRYRQFLATDITNEASSRMHLECAMALVSRLVPAGLIVIDDTWWAGEGNDGAWAGKGSTAVPWLLGRGFEIVGRTRTAVALERTSGG